MADKERELFDRYLTALKEEFETIKNPALFSHNKSAGLEKIYVPLQLNEKRRDAESPLKDEITGDMRIDADQEKNLREETRFPQMEVQVEPGQTGNETDVERALRKHRYVFITGPPGSGKTAMIQFLILKMCRENRSSNEPVSIPVPVNLREFVRGKKRLRDHVFQIFEKYGIRGAKKRIEKILIQGKCTFFFDGFDELFTSKEREKVVHEIHNFLKKYRNCPVLVTSRDAGYCDRLNGFARIELGEFSNKQIRRFIDQWFGPANRGKTDAVIHELTKNKDIEFFARNPLMLTIITTFYDQNYDMRQKRCDLYKRIIDILLDEWDVPKKIGNRFSISVKKYILRKLAYRNHTRRHRSLTEKEILEVIERYAFPLGFKKEQSRSILEEIVQRSHILRQLFKGSYDFHHLSFREYFTALELAEHQDGLGILYPHLSDPYWEETILLYAGIKRDATPLINMIRKEKPEDIFFSNLILAGKCIAEAEHTDLFLKEEVTREIWHLINSSDFQLLKGRAVAVLTRLQPRFIIDELVNQLTDKELGVRRFAADTLGLIGSVDVLPALLMILTKDTDSKIRGQAAAALGEIRSREALQPLIRVLGSEKEGDVRCRAAAALGTIGSDEALPALFKTLTKDPDSVVRGAAAEAIGIIENPGSIFRLSLTLSTEKQSSVRWRTALALGKLRGSDARDLLIEALSSDRDKEVRESAAEGLGHIGSTECIAALINALSSDNDADVRGSAAFALGQIESKEALPALIRSLVSDTDAEVRGRAAFALGRLRNTEAVPYLVATFNTHKESMIRGNAAYALGEIGGAEAIPFLIQALTLDKDSYVRYRAAEVLGSIGSVVTVRPLKIALEDEGSYYGWRVKDKAYEALEKISKRFHVRITPTRNKGE